MRTTPPCPALIYTRSLFAQQTPFLTGVANTLQDNRKQMQIGPEEGKLLALLASMIQAKTIVEIGTLAGYSTLWMASALPADGHIYTLEKSPEHAAIARGNFTQSPYAAQITLLEGDAQENLRSLPLSSPLDMVFIDADKGGYTAYLDWAEAHLRPGGLVVGDNTLLFGSVYQDSPPAGISRHSWEVMREFNRRLADPEKYVSMLLPTVEGLTVAWKKPLL